MRFKGPAYEDGYHYHSTRRHPVAPQHCLCGFTGPYGKPTYVGTTRIDGTLCNAWRGWESYGAPRGADGHPLRSYVFQTARGAGQ